MKESVSDNTDSIIGERIRARRKIVGFSAQHFASILGVSYQQLSKYESGVNRVSASQLATIAKLLNTDMQYFFSNNNVLPFFTPKPDSFRSAQIINEPETSTLVKHYVSISDYRTRMAVVELVSSITKLISKRARKID